MAAKRAAATAQTCDEDARRTMSQWERLDLASLHLKCNNYNLTATGKKSDLATRLVRYFEDDSSSTSSSSNNESNSPLPSEEEEDAGNAPQTDDEG